MHWCLSLLAAGTALLETGQASSLTPPVVPLTVRTPYLSTWLGDARITPWNKWPMFWTGEEIGFGVLAAVPKTGYVYPLLGRPHDSLLLQDDDSYNVSYCTYEGATFDASTTNLTYSIPVPKESADSAPSPPLEVVLSFLSPITPTSTLRQSIPASYLTVYVRGHFDVDIYVDINGQWVSGDRGARINWDLEKTQLAESKGLNTWKVTREEEMLFSEIADRAEWGTLYFSAPSDARYEAGVSGLLRPRFARTGTLQNAIDEKFRTIMDEEPVFAFSKSFDLQSSSVKPKQDSIRFTIAHVQDPVVQYAAPDGLTLMKPLWKYWYSTVEQVLKFHYLDFENVSKLAYNYTTQLANDAQNLGGEEYEDVLALTARQVIGASSFSGTPENPLIFQKEISSSGNLNTIDMIFPSFPFYLYTNPRWLPYMLEPIIAHTLSGQYPNDYALHDLGAHFPNATGHPDGNDEYMPVEECGNILIMGLAIVNSLKYGNNAGSVWASMGSEAFDDDPASSAFSLKNLEERDGIPGLDDSWGGSTNGKGAKQAEKWVRQSYKLWRQWTKYLIDFSLEPSNQLSTDDFAGPLQLQVNLALKGIIGIKAMSELAATVSNKPDYEEHLNISETYVDKWVEFGLSRDGNHMKLAYDWYGSWGNIYNLYADSLLCFHLEGTSLALSDRSPIHPFGDDGQKPIKPDPRVGFVPHNIYSLQSKQYHNVRQRYGLPLDSRHLYGKTDWMFFSTAVTSESTRAEILHSMAKWVNETNTDRPLTDVHNTEGEGEFQGAYFIGRPAVGGHFAWLTLENACGGKAREGLSFLEEEDSTQSDDEDVTIISYEVTDEEL
ncbi:hypothetical protein ACLMJK_002248 [Lecanora helva]